MHPLTANAAQLTQPREDGVYRTLTLKKTLGRKQKRITFVDFVEKEGEALFEVTNQLGLEGVMAKRANSIYRRGYTRDWLKIKTALGKEREAKRFEGK